MSHKPGFENDTTYNRNAPTLTDEQVRGVYAKAGLDYETGLPVERAPSVKNALCSGKFTAGALSVDAPYWALKQAARACGCMTCEGALTNIRDAVVNYALSPRSYHAKWARQNRDYFIQRLREVIFSQSINHNK
jgi:hypothetical protein